GQGNDGRPTGQQWRDRVSRPGGRRAAALRPGQPPARRHPDRALAGAQQGRRPPDPPVADLPLAAPGRPRVDVRPGADGDHAGRQGVEPARHPLTGLADPAPAPRRHPRDHDALRARGPPAHLPRPVREPPGGQDGRRARPPLPPALRRLEPGHPGPPPHRLRRRGGRPAAGAPDRPRRRGVRRRAGGDPRARLRQLAQRARHRRRLHRRALLRRRRQRDGLDQLLRPRLAVRRGGPPGPRAPRRHGGEGHHRGTGGRL
ncbi:MAG: Transcriptional regulator, IclR family, partial [uncultured Nocardioides sp.]